MEIAGGLKFCINCHHVASSSTGDSSRYRCMAPQNLSESRIDLVTGNTEKIYKQAMCHLVREDANLCGKRAEWFKEKEYKPLVAHVAAKPATKSVTADDL